MMVLMVQKTQRLRQPTRLRTLCSEQEVSKEITVDKVTRISYIKTQLETNEKNGK